MHEHLTSTATVSELVSETSPGGVYVLDPSLIGRYCSFSVLVYAVVLLTVLLTVVKSQVFSDRIMGVVDLLTATAGLKGDLDADVINGHPLKAQMDNLGIAWILLIEVCQKFDL